MTANGLSEKKNSILEINDLCFAYPEEKKRALNHVSLHVEDGEFLVLCGKSGCGKSTLLTHLKTPLTPHGKRKGEILFQGVPIGEMSNREQSQRIGYVLQNPDNQIVTDKVWHELAFGLESLGYSNADIRIRVAEMASYFGIQDWFYKNVSELSGGQKQLLNLASIMAMHPDMLILDEPTAGLDPKQRIAVRNLISEIAFQKIVLIATHVVTDVEFISKEIVLLKDGQVIKKAERETLTANLEGKVYEIKVPVSELKRIQQTYLVGNIVKEREWIYVRIVSDTLPQEKNVTIVRPSLEDVYLYYFRE